MRRGELLGLRWEHVNLGSAPRTFVIGGETWEVPSGRFLTGRSKDGRPRALPLSGKAQGIPRLPSEDETKGEYVSQNGKTGVNISDIKTGFTAACRDAGINDLTFHDLRHTWSTRAAECGVPDSVRRDILGHSPVTMTDSYTHSGPEAMERAMELVADYSREKIFSLTAKARQAR